MLQLFGKKIPAKKILIAGAGYGETFYTPSVQSLFDLAIEFERRAFRTESESFRIGFNDAASHES